MLQLQHDKAPGMSGHLASPFWATNWPGVVVRERYLLALGKAAAEDERSSVEPESASREYPLEGRLYVSRSGWVLLSVPNRLVQGAYTSLREPGAELPKNRRGVLQAHISVMHPSELEAIGGPDRLVERGRTFRYTLDRLESVKPLNPNWERVWMLRAYSPELEQLRKSYGLSPRPNQNRFHFHITVAVRPKPCHDQRGQPIPGCKQAGETIWTSGGEPELWHWLLGPYDV